MSEALIPVRKAEIALGKPLPWAIYDANHVLLLNKGAWSAASPSFKP